MVYLSSLTAVSPFPNAHSWLRNGVDPAYDTWDDPSRPHVTKNVGSTKKVAATKQTSRRHMSNEKHPGCLGYRDTGCLLGILIMVHDNPHITG